MFHFFYVNVSVPVPESSLSVYLSYLISGWRIGLFDFYDEAIGAYECMRVRGLFSSASKKRSLLSWLFFRWDNVDLQCRNSYVHEFVFKELKVKTRVYFRGSLRIIIGHDFSTSIYVASVEAHCLHSALRHRRERHTSIYHSCYGFSDFFFMLFG